MDINWIDAATKVGIPGMVILIMFWERQQERKSYLAKLDSVEGLVSDLCNLVYQTLTMGLSWRRGDQAVGDTLAQMVADAAKKLVDKAEKAGEGQ